MGEIIEGSKAKYIGAFYPQEQDDDDYNNEWSVCADDLNLVLASYKNYEIQSFANNAVKVFTNNYSSRVAICWDVCYAYSKAYGQQYNAFTKGAAREHLEDAMQEVADAINDMSLSSSEKEQYWKDINWGGFVADEPIAAFDSNQDEDDDIENKCKALQDAFDNISDCESWGSPNLKKMVVLHRKDGCQAWNEGSGETQCGGDDEFEERAPVWDDFGSDYRVNIWGMDPYIWKDSGTTENDDDIKADRNYFFDTLVDNNMEDKDTHFLAMIGKAFKPDTGQWLTETQTWYYYNDIQGCDQTRQLEWEDQFEALFWWAYCTAALATGSTNVDEGYDECSTPKTYIEDISDDNW